MLTATCSRHVWQRALIALLCAITLSLTTFSLGRARALALQSHDTRAISLAAASSPKPCQNNILPGPTCVFAGFCAAGLSTAHHLPPASSAQALRLSITDERSPVSRAGGVPFRPPRTVV